MKKEKGQHQCWPLDLQNVSGLKTLDGDIFFFICTIRHKTYFSFHTSQKKNQKNFHCLSIIGLLLFVWNADATGSAFFISRKEQQKLKNKRVSIYNDNIG
ncbi:MAG: hypothetical protein ACYC21_14765 [Eubacteriales bacterium]